MRRHAGAAARWPARLVRAALSGMGQNEATRGPLVLVFVSICQGSILGPYF